MSKILQVKNLTKKFKGFTAVDAIDFDIERGEIVGLLGPNGAGKTTTIQMLLGLTKPDMGCIKIFGKELEKNRSELLDKMNFSSAYISFPHRMSIRENLEVFAKLYGVRDWRERMDKLLAMLEISDLEKKLFVSLSSGQRTRVFLVKALLNKPRLLLLDEPTASLDPDIAEKIKEMLIRIQKEEGITILYTSHNMAEVEELCNRVIFLSHGKIVAQGTPLELKRMIPDYSLNLVFRESPDKMKKFVFEKNLRAKFPRKGYVEILLEEEQIPKILSDLYKQDFEFLNIDVNKPDLEDVFLKISREKRMATDDSG